ncbi:MAG: hypothetical protein ACP5RQ_03400 [Candidatus Micrarchaeia archaeon]
MKKYVIEELKHFVSNDKGWYIFNYDFELDKPYFLLFKIFKPLDKILEIPNSIDNQKVNIIFIHKKQLERDILEIDEQGIVLKFLFKPTLDYYVPFAVFIKDYNDIKFNFDIENMLKKIIEKEYIVKKM